MIKMRKVRAGARGEFLKVGDRLLQVGDEYTAGSEDEALYLERYVGFERVSGSVLVSQDDEMPLDQEEVI